MSVVLQGNISRCVFRGWGVRLHICERTCMKLWPQKEPCEMSDKLSQCCLRMKKIAGCGVRKKSEVAGSAPHLYLRLAASG